MIFVMHEQFEKAAQYWNNKEQISVPEDKLKQADIKYIKDIFMLTNY